MRFIPAQSNLSFEHGKSLSNGHPKGPLFRHQTFKREGICILTGIAGLIGARKYFKMDNQADVRLEEGNQTSTGFSSRESDLENRMGPEE